MLFRSLFLELITASEGTNGHPLNLPYVHNHSVVRFTLKPQNELDKMIALGRSDKLVGARAALDPVSLCHPLNVIPLSACAASVGWGEKPFFIFRHIMFPHTKGQQSIKILV